jgi:hypothetical protein
MISDPFDFYVVTPAIITVVALIGWGIYEIHLRRRAKRKAHQTPSDQP